MDEQSIHDINMDGVQPAEDKCPIKPGPQRVRVSEVEFTVSSQKKTPGVKITMQYVNEAGLVPMTEGMKPQAGITDTLWLSPNALPMFARAIKAFGIDWESWKETKDLQVLIGLEADVVVSLEPNMNNPDRKHNEVSRYLVPAPMGA